MKRFLLLWLVLQGSIVVTAQDISNVPLRWQTNSSVDLKSNEAGGKTSEFVSRPTEIIWMQKGGQSVKHFKISSVEGNWKDVSSQGTVSYNVTEGDVSGRITFERTQSGVFVTLDFTNHRSTAIKRRFEISSIENEN